MLSYARSWGRKGNKTDTICVQGGKKEKCLGGTGHSGTVCNLTFREAEVEDCKFNPGMDNLARTCHKMKNKWAGGVKETEVQCREADQD